MKKKSKLNSFFIDLGKLNEKYTITLRIPARYVIVAVLILMALTGKVGVTIAFFIAAFLVFILILPDDF